MATKRVIGIDFGTSTSVVMIKYYDGNEPLESRNFYQCLKFGGRSTVPTLVYESKEDNEHLCGYDAETPGFPGTLYSGFKMDLISLDLEKREKAYDLTRKFFRYLFTRYQEQKPYFKPCDSEQTFVSYPAKWPQDIRELMAGFASEAGFQNVTGLDEPTAAIHTVMTQEIERLQEKRLAIKGETANFLIVDMGAGTTDLAVCRHTFGNQNEVQLLSTWPTADNPSLFGGREVDKMLHGYIADYLKNCSIPLVFNDKYLKDCKAWKEATVAPNLKKEESVTTCGTVSALLAHFSDVPKPFPPLHRENFQTLLDSYLVQFAQMVNDCLKVTKKMHPGFTDIDFVILTGGHSQWYFVPEILLNKLSFSNGIGVSLPKIEANPELLITLPVPQETVALGLVFQPMSVKMKSISANNVWVQISVDGNKTNPQQIVSFGQVLPFCTQISTELNITQTSTTKQNNCTCTRYYGETLETAVEYTVAFSLPYNAFTQLGGWAKKLLGKPTSTRKLNIVYDLNTDENQCTQISGKISDDTFFANSIEFEL